MLHRHFRLIIYTLVLLAGLASMVVVSRARAEVRKTEAQIQVAIKDSQDFHRTVVLMQDFQSKLATYQDQGIAIESAQEALKTIRAYLSAGKYTEAQELIVATENALSLELSTKQEEARLAEQARLEAESAELQRQAEAEAKRGNLEGYVRTGKTALSAATVYLQIGSSAVTSVTTGTDGKYSFRQDAGTYTVVVERKGYVRQEVSDITITAGTTSTKDISLEKVPTVAKATPAPTATPTTSSSTAYSTYQSLSVTTERGTFSIKVLTVDFSSGRVRAVTDTAADGDCLNDCPVKPLKDYVTAHGAFAGINGTYFCPTAYADCAGKTNSFYWKIFNSRLNTMINKDNLLGERDPFLTFDTSNSPRFYNYWTDHSSPEGLSAGISCRPLLVSGGQNVLDTGTLDDKQRSTKSARAALGLKGKTLYAVVASSATVIDLASIMTYLGVDSSMNIDGGGSTALYYNGSYKAGPGRSLPNALVFVELP